MGDIAEMMLDGTLDDQTGEYIGKPCGYPRSNQYSGSTKSNRRGVSNYIHNFNLKHNLELQFNTVVNIYWKDVLKHKPTGLNNKCNKIQRDFPRFVKWVKETYKS